MSTCSTPSGTLAAACDHLRKSLPLRGRDYDEQFAVDVRWAWTPAKYDTTFLVAEISSLHEAGIRADRRWDALDYAPLRDSRAWSSLGYVQPLREALLTHWHESPHHSFVTTSLNDRAVPTDHYDHLMFTHRTLVRPSSPPWRLDEEQPILRYLARLADGGPPLADDYWPFPRARNGSKAEMWTLCTPSSKNHRGSGGAACTDTGGSSWVENS